MGPLDTALKPLLFNDTAKTTSRAGFWYITEKSVGTELGGGKWNPLSSSSSFVVALGGLYLMEEETPMGNKSH